MAKNSDRPLCFVIGPIGDDGTEVRKHADDLLLDVIKPVLEAREFGYRVKRADEDADPGMISDRMVSDIIRADLVVADLTDLNPNAFYELGIRHSRVKPVIHVARSGTVLPFDNASYRTIMVDVFGRQGIDRARTQLTTSARAIRAPDYKVSNPITQANASFQMLGSADLLDRVIQNPSERTSFHREMVRISDVVSEGDPLISGVTFNRCHILGPGFIKPQNQNTFEFCSCPSRDILIAVPPGSPIAGAIILSRNVFRQCYFDAVNVVGTPQDISDVRDGFDPITLSEWKAKVSFS